jgi:hypothetical protein
MHGCGLRIGESLAVNLRCRINRGKTLRVNEQVDPLARLRPLKFRRAGEFRDIPLPEYVSEAINKHVAEHGITADGYLFQGRKHKLVVHRSYQQDFQRAAARAGLATSCPHPLTAPAPHSTPPTRRVAASRPGTPEAEVNSTDMSAAACQQGLSPWQCGGLGDAGDQRRLILTPRFCCHPPAVPMQLSPWCRK